MDDEAPPSPSRWLAPNRASARPTSKSRLAGAARRAGKAWSTGLAARAGSTAVLILASIVAMAITFGAKEACRAGAWNVGVEQYQAHCYTDIYPLYFGEGLSAGQVPYFDHNVQYPVVMGAAMQAAALVVHPISDVGVRGREFYDVTVILLGICLVGGVLATAYCAGRERRWTALAVALSPALILGALINWDLIAMAVTMLALAAWAARRPAIAGALLGVAVATKFYPIVCFVPLFALCMRAGRMREFWTTTGTAAAAWLALNLPIMLGATSGWATFYIFSSQRGADWGSIWYFFQTEHWPVLDSLSLSSLNLVSGGLFVLACAAIVVLALAAPRRPRLPQLIFLATAAFLLSNKVWSPQYVVWLVPLVVLARPRPGGYLVWQAAEVGYFYAIWAYLIYIVAGPSTSGAIGPGLYFAALLARFCTVLLLCLLVIRDVWRPDLDVVRAGGQVDDPAGGVLDGSPDRLIFRLRPAGGPAAWRP